LGVDILRHDSLKVVDILGVGVGKIPSPEKEKKRKKQMGKV